MSKPATTDLKRELQKSLELMGSLRDEIRMKLHLGSMDAKDRWRELEGQLASVEKTAAEAATEAARGAVTSAISELEKLRASLR